MLFHSGGVKLSPPTQALDPKICNQLFKLYVLTYLAVGHRSRGNIPTSIFLAQHRPGRLTPIDTATVILHIDSWARTRWGLLYMVATLLQPLSRAVGPLDQRESDPSGVTVLYMGSISATLCQH